MTDLWKPQSWIMHPLAEWTPQTLPGYAEAVEKIARGESLFPKRIKGPPREKRTVESLTAERDRLIVRRSLLYAPPDDPGMVSGVQRRPTTGSRKQEAAIDNALAEHTRLTRRIDYLEGRIA